MTVTLDIFADPVCPWCLIGKAELDRALESRPDHPFDVTWRPFRLNPDMPRSGMAHTAYMLARFKDDKGIIAANRPVLEAAERLGLWLNMAAIDRIPDTTDAHRLLHLVQRVALVDADLANNSASWQWVAGSGADAAPYFRIFNPISQGPKFDPDGKYVRRWVPELAKLPTKHLFSPFEAAASVLREAGVRLGETYPYPIVDHGKARQAALDGYEDVKSAGQDAA